MRLLVIIGATSSWLAVGCNGSSSSLEMLPQQGGATPAGAQRTAGVDLPPPVAPSASQRLVAAAAEDHLAALLRPYEGALPPREYLDRTIESPEVVLTKLARESDDDVVRKNALHELGLFPDSQGVVDLLMSIAADAHVETGDRAAAIGGLAQPGMFNESRARTLLPLLHDRDPLVQTAAVIALVPWRFAHPEIQRIIDDPQSDADVRRIANNRMKAGAPLPQ